MTANTASVDALVKEYLVFRGFTTSLRAFEAEMKADKDKGFQVDKLIELMFSYISSYDIVGLKDFWAHLECRFFSKLDHSFASPIRKLYICLQRYYIVHAIQNGRGDRVLEFFERYATELQSQTDWRDWFVLPFLKSPELHPIFETFFSKQWLETFTLSMHNFLATVFQSIHVPTLLSLDAERLRARSLEEELSQLQQRLQQQILLQDGNASSLGHGRYDIKGEDFNEPLSSSSSAPLHQANSDVSQYIGTSVKSVYQSTSRWPSQWVHSQSQHSSPLSSTPAKQRSSPMCSPEGIPPRSVEGTYELQDISTMVVGETRKLRRELSSNTNEDTDKEDDMFGNQNGNSNNLHSQAVCVNTSSECFNETVRNGNIDGSLCDDEPFIILSTDVFSEHTNPVTQCRFSPEGSLIASADITGVVRIWNNARNGPPSSHLTLADETPRLLCFEWDSKSDRRLFLGSDDGVVKLFDTTTRSTLFDVRVGPESARVVALASTPMGASFVVATESHSQSEVGQLYSFNQKTTQLEKELQLDPLNTRVNSMVHNHNGNMLVSGGADGMIRIFDMKSYSCIMGWHAHDGGVCCVHLSFDENTVFSMGADGMMSQWSLHHVGRLKHFEINTFPPEHERMPTAAQFAFGDRGDYLLTTSPRNSGLVYPSGSRTPVMRLGSHTDGVVCVDWSPITNTCLTGSIDGTVNTIKLLGKL